MKYQKEAHEFLINKGVKSMKNSYNVITIQTWLSEFAKCQIDKLNKPEIGKSFCDYCGTEVNIQIDAVVCGTCREKIGF